MRKAIRPLLSALFAAGALRAQQPRGAIAVVVLDAATGAPIPNALVQVRTAARFASTDSAGRAFLGAIAVGIQRVAVRRLGYNPTAFELALTAGDTADATVRLVPSAGTLPDINIVDTATSPWLDEFEKRRRTAMGRYITDAQLRSRFGSALGDILMSRIPGIRIDMSPNGLDARVLSARGPTGFDARKGDACPVELWIDGVRSSTGNLNDVPREWIAGIEYHTPGNIPVQYSVGNPGCGVLLLWTR